MTGTPISAGATWLRHAAESVVISAADEAPADTLSDGGTWKHQSVGHAASGIGGRCVAVAFKCERCPCCSVRPLLTRNADCRGPYTDLPLRRLSPPPQAAPDLLGLSRPLSRLTKCPECEARRVAERERKARWRAKRRQA